VPTSLFMPDRPDGSRRTTDRRGRPPRRRTGRRISRRSAFGVGARRTLARLPTGPILLALAASIAIMSLRVAPSEVDAASAEPVVIATVTLDPGSIVGSDDIEVRRLPVIALPPGAVADADQVVGRQVTAAIFGGEPVLAGRLAPDGLVGIAAVTPPGWSAFALPTEPGLPPAAVGQRVDLYAPASVAPSGVAGAAERSADRIARDALVVAIDDQRVTVAVDAADAPAVATALIGATVVLAVTGPAAGP